MRVRRGGGTPACARSCCCAARVARSAQAATSRASTRATDDVRGYLDGLVTPLLRAAWPRFPAPTFAAAHGACLGVGLGLLIATDVVYVADTREDRLAVREPRGDARLRRARAVRRAARRAPHARPDLHGRAHVGRRGGGGRAVQPGGARRRAVAFTRERAPRAAHGATAGFPREQGAVATLRDERLGLWESLAAENARPGRLCDTDDYREGFAAFQQKRTPVFGSR